jgi:hypothetical protein
MSTVDQKVEQLADKLQEVANRSAAEGGAKAKLAQPLADDAEFLRKLKPSLIKARMRGDAPTAREPARGRVMPAASPRRRKTNGDGGPNPWLVVGACLVAGIALAKWIDWRGHAHPRD